MRARQDELLEAVEALVAIESPSKDVTATVACGEAVAALGERLLGAPAQHVQVDGRTHVRWRIGHPRVLVLGHLDTVWPVGTVARWPFEVSDGRATGPGVFDMKAGLVQGLFALSELDDLDGVCVLVTSDEELGSPSSRGLIEDTANGLRAALVLEPSAGGALKVGRKGVSQYQVVVHGRAAHAGLEPEQGANALVELSHQVASVAALADTDLGTTVTPAVASAGTATNVVPARASFEVDVRVASVEEQQRVHGQMTALEPVVAGTRLEVTGEPNRPPLPTGVSSDLFARARRLADEAGLPPLEGAQVGGASDGNFTAGLGVPTLDGLGAVGAGAHAEGEYAVVDAMPERAALVAALVDDLLRDGPPTDVNGV